jgi:hypothetical protein
MKRVILGFLLGYIFIGLATVMTHQLLYARMVPSEDSPRTQYLAVITATDILLAILGGWFCATVSLKAREATLALVIVGEVSRVAVALLFWSAVPHFYNFVDWIVYPPAVWLGARLGSRVVPKMISNRSD